MSTGHPKRPSFIEDLDTISKAMGWTALILVASTLSAPVLLVKAASVALGAGNPIQSTMDDGGVLWEAGLRTAPFTAVVTLMGIGILRGSLSLLAVPLYGGGALIIAALLADLVDPTTATRFERAMQTPLSGNIVESTIQMVGVYANVYSAPYLIAGCVVGGFTAWAIARHILPHLN